MMMMMMMMMECPSVKISHLMGGFPSKILSPSSILKDITLFDWPQRWKCWNVDVGLQKISPGFSTCFLAPTELATAVGLGKRTIFVSNSLHINSMSRYQLANNWVYRGQSQSLWFQIFMLSIKWVNLYQQASEGKIFSQTRFFGASSSSFKRRRGTPGIAEFQSLFNLFLVDPPLCVLSSRCSNCSLFVDRSSLYMVVGVRCLYEIIRRLYIIL